MLSIRSLLSTVLHPAPATNLPSSSATPEVPNDRIHFDLLGVSDTDALWYYETRRWRGRD